MANAATSILDTTPHLATSEISFRRILLAVDFSTQTAPALKAALSLAKAFQAEIILVNAAVPSVYGTGAESAPIVTLRLNLDVAKAQMARLISSEPGLQEVKHHDVVAYARPLDLVRQVVQDQRVDLVIAGSHGARGLERLALGSVAESILRHIMCPALILGPHAEASENVFQSILLATDLKVATLRAAQYASSLAERFHSKLTLLHVIEPRSKTADVEPELTERHVMRSLKSLLPSDLSNYCKASLRVECGKPGDLISHVAKCESASLIVSGVGEHSSFADHTPWSTLAQVIREARCPVLCVRHEFATC